MNKIFYSLGFLLFFILLNNNAKAQTAGDVAACPKNGSGQILISSILDDDDQTCDGEGATNVTLNVYSLGFCTSEPKIRFASDADRLTDQRDRTDSSYYTDGTSDFSSCTWTIKGSSTFSESLEGVGDVEPLPNDEIPPAGTYTHAVVVISNELQITGTANFSDTIIDSTGIDVEVTSGNSGTKCWTNGTFFLDTGQEGPLIGLDVDDAKVNKGLGRVRGGAECGPTPSPTANTIKYYYADVQGFGNTTRSEEITAFGTLSVLYTKADLDSLATNSPDITRPAIESITNYGTTTQTNTLTLVFAYNSPMKVTGNTTGMDIFVNFSNALSLDFEPTNMDLSTTSENRSDGKVDFTVSGTTTTSTSPPRIRAIQSGPLGIQFKATEAGITN